MVDSEKAVNPIMDDSEEKNTAVNTDNDFDLNLGDSEEEKSQNSSDLFSEDVKDGEATDEKKLPKEEHDLFEDEAETENELFSNNESNDVSAEKKAEEDSVSLEDTDENIEEPTFDAPTINLSDEESTVEDNASAEDSGESIEEPTFDAPTIDLSDEESTVEDNASAEDSGESIEEPAVEAHTIDLSDEESTVEDNASTEDSEESIEEPVAEAATINLSDEEDSVSLEDTDENIEEPVAEAATINLSDEESTVEDTASTEDSSDESEIPVAKPSFEDNFKERLKNAETLNNEDDEATANQDTSALLGKFDNVVIAPTIEKTESDSSITVDFSETIQEHPAVLEKSPITQANEKEEEERAKLIQKEKIAQLIKSHEKKGKRVGFTKGILSGIVLVACAVIVSCIFAKDQVLDIINSDFLNGLSLSANVVEVSNNTDEEKTDEENVADEENIDDEENGTEYEVVSDNGTGTDEQIADVLEIASDEDTTTANEEIASDETTVDEETTNDEENNDKEFSITNVASEEEANWVLPFHCSDLTCGEDKEFTPCTTFKLSESLDENANRIGNNGVCRYKDPSELVYVEFK